MYEQALQVVADKKHHAAASMRPKSVLFLLILCTRPPLPCAGMQCLGTMQLYHSENKHITLSRQETVCVSWLSDRLQFCVCYCPAPNTTFDKSVKVTDLHVNTSKIQSAVAEGSCWASAGALTGAWAQAEGQPSYAGPSPGSRQGGGSLQHYCG